MNQNKKYCVYIPYFVRKERKYRIDAFTTQYYTKDEIESMESTATAAAQILDSLDGQVKDTPYNISISDIVLELGHFVNQEVRTSNKAMSQDDILPGYNTISFWDESEESKDGELQRTIVNKTFIVNLGKLKDILSRFDVKIQMDQQPDDIDNLAKDISRDPSLSPAIKLNRLYYKKHSPDGQAVKTL